MKNLLVFTWRCLGLSLQGNWLYYTWMFILSALALLGLNAYCKQFVDGLIHTGMTDQVSWGIYIANFTFLVGMAAAAVMLVIPVYIYRNKELHNLVIFGELLAIASIIMCLLFVNVDLGRPDRFLHIFMRFNFPDSMLTWDVVAIGGYLLLNVHICGYLIYSAYRGQKPRAICYVPFVFLAIFWAISIHTVTAFLYVGLGGRPFWNSAIIAPRFLASAFAAGPALLIITLQIIRKATSLQVSEKALTMLRYIVTTALSINLFLLGCELFTEFYAGSHHIASMVYLFFGLHGYHALVPWIWTAVAMNCVALLILYLPLAKNTHAMNLACALMIIGIWIEKGMGLVIPAFIPTPLGEMVEYNLTWNETFVSLGIWAFGLLLYTVFVRITIPVLSGQLRLSDNKTDSQVTNDNTADH